jgi:uncharacterized membrane protein
MGGRDPVEKVRSGFGFERMLFFSDAVFAIAITLLVIDLRPGPGRFSLPAVMPHIIAFGISFYVIGRYWLAHHELLEVVQGYDHRLLTTNLAFLAAVAVLPFTTSLISTGTGSEDPDSVAVYALSLAAVGFMLLALVLAARRPGILKPDQTRGGTASRIVTGLASPLVFCFTAVIARFAPHALWWLLLLFPAGYGAHRLGEALARRIDAAETPAA